MKKLTVWLVLIALFIQSPAHAHRGYTGATASVGTCGVTPTITGNDSIGTVTIGSGVVTACTVTFATTWASTPICIVNDDSGSISAGITSISTSAFTVGLSATLGSGHIYYICGEKQ